MRVTPVEKSALRKRQFVPPGLVAQTAAVPAAPTVRPWDRSEASARVRHGCPDRSACRSTWLGQRPRTRDRRK